YKEKQFLFSFFPAHANPSNCLRGFELSLGKIFNGIGAGFIKTYATKNYQLLSDTVDEGLASVLSSGIETNPVRLEGFLPLGKPFTITRIRAQRNLILEINNRPAINIYKHYLDEKFDIFTKNRLFTLYPMGIQDRQQTRLINILDYLDDGSLAYIGPARENALANLMIFHPPSFVQSLKRRLGHEIARQHGVAFVVNSTVRKKILKDYAAEEIRLIKNQLGNNIKVIGLYADYAVYPDAATKEGVIETGNTYIALCQ
ncbi:MAG: FIST C-terminal domain-containing protein, partial [Candidatus Omnitrophica bacterium]|nr:FIST C-terminal domain-containing protein [Candidatus Omnitrophota bacterium]